MQQVATLTTEFATSANSERKVVSFDTQSQGVIESNERQVFADDLAREIVKQEKSNQSREQHFATQTRKEQSVAKEKQSLVDAEMQQDVQDSKKQALQSEQQQNETEQLAQREQWQSDQNSQKDKTDVANNLENVENKVQIDGDFLFAADASELTSMVANTAIMRDDEISNTPVLSDVETNNKAILSYGETNSILPVDYDKPHNTQWDELLFAAKNTSTELKDGASKDPTDTLLTDSPITDKVQSGTIQLANKHNVNDLENGKAVSLDASAAKSDTPYSDQISTDTAAMNTQSLLGEAEQTKSATTIANNVVVTAQDNLATLKLDSAQSTSTNGKSVMLDVEQSVLGESSVLDEASSMPDKTLLAAVLSDALQDKKTSHLRQAEGLVSRSENVKTLAQINHVSGGANNPNVMDPALSMTTQLTPEQIESLAQQTATKLAQAGAFEGQTDTAKTQFVGQFKAALGEIKEQLENGRMAGIDLRSLIQSALPANEASLGKAIEGITQQLQQNLPNIQQALQQATQQTLQQVANGTEVIGSIQDIQRNSAETQQLSAEQTKTSTPSPSKPLNMEKPEGMQQLTEKVRFMANNRQITADMRLDPADLGSMQIRVSMQGDTASVNFVVQNAQAREVLEQATARLSEMLSEQGIQLGESNIQQDNSSSDNSSDDSSSFASGGADSQNNQFSEEVEQDGNIIAEQRITNGNIGGIDFYA